MDNLKSVFTVVLKLMNTRLTFEPFSFTILDMSLSFLALSIVIWFVYKIFD